MLRAFRWNLTALSYISLIVGAFLIYNTIAVSVVRRRGEIGTLRALGATSGQVLRLFLAEALFLGLAGGIAGVGLVAFWLTLRCNWFPAQSTLSTTPLRPSPCSWIGI